MIEVMPRRRSNADTTTVDLLSQIIARQHEIRMVAARHGAHNVRLFGSAARGEADARSDIDILVDLEPGRSLLDLGGLLMDLRELFGRDVDVVTGRGLKPRIRARVLREAIAL